MFMPLGMKDNQLVGEETMGGIMTHGCGNTVSLTSCLVATQP